MVSNTAQVYFKNFINMKFSKKILSIDIGAKQKRALSYAYTS